MFYDIFEKLCKEKGVRPTNACVEAGLSRGLAAKWKSTKTEMPSADALKKLSVYFGKTVEELMGTEEKEKPHVQEDIGPNKQAVLDLIDDLSESEAALLLERVKKIKESRV